MNVYISPLENSSNEYIRILSGIITNIDSVKVKGISSLSLSHFMEREQNCAVLNWYEDSVFDRKKGLFSWSLLLVLFFKLIYIKIICKKIIYIKHNYKPHCSSNGSIIFSLSKYFMGCAASIKVAHVDNIDGFEFVTHPLYLCDKKVLGNIESEHGRDVEYFIFGAVSRYKKLNDLLKAWPVGYKLIIWGRSNDIELEKEILDIINNRNLSVSWRNEFIEFEELNSKLLTCKNVIVNNDDDTMIVSGVFYHAISFGCNVLVNQSVFSDFAKRHYGSVCADFNLGNLNSALNKEYSSVDSTILDLAGREQLTEKWRDLIFN